MAKKKSPEPERPERPHADKAMAARRVDEILRIRLDGAEFWDLCEFVRGKELLPGSNWFLQPGTTPLSESQIRRYQGEADALISSAHERSRKKLFRRHLARRRHLYAKAATSGDLRTALACVQDEAKLLGLYPLAEKGRGEQGSRNLGPVEFISTPARRDAIASGRDQREAPRATD